MTKLAFLFQSPGGGIGGMLLSMLPLFLIFGVFYMLIIVPQRKRQRELQETVANLKAGDRIVTTGGIIGTVTAVRDATLLVRSADKSILEISRSSVASLQDIEEKK